MQRRVIWCNLLLVEWRLFGISALCMGEQARIERGGGGRERERDERDEFDRGAIETKRRGIREVAAELREMWGERVCLFVCLVS